MTTTPIDLVGGPFSVIESDPAVFTSLSRKLGIKNLELVELYDIEPWAIDHLKPYGLIFCFLWSKDTHRPADFEDPAAEGVWFANQVSDDACASLALLNVVLNCPNVDVGEELRLFREDTRRMSPVIKGLAIASSPLIREAHNSLARPADIRGALNALTTTTLSAKKKDTTKKPPAKKRKTTKSSEKPKPVPKKAANDSSNDTEEAFHFIGYVPAFGKVWELDGLKSGPLEVGELLQSSSSQPPNTYPNWMDVARPALRMKMRKYGASPDGEGGGGGNIRFSLLALVDGLFEKASDEWEFWRKERRALERRLDEEGGEDWKNKVNPELLHASTNAFSLSPSDSSSSSSSAGYNPNPFAQDFSSRRMQRDIHILDLPIRKLCSEWELCVTNAIRAKIALEDELVKAGRENTEHIKRTHDYEPFLVQFVTCLKNEGLLEALLDVNQNNGKSKTKSK